MSEGRLKPRKIPRQQRAEVTVASIVEAAARILEYGGLDAAESRYAALSIEPSIAWDMIGIIRGMVDGAVAKGERDIEQVVGRVQRAVEGYLTLSRVSLAS